MTDIVYAGKRWKRSGFCLPGVVQYQPGLKSYFRFLKKAFLLEGEVYLDTAFLWRHLPLLVYRRIFQMPVHIRSRGGLGDSFIARGYSIGGQSLKKYCARSTFKLCGIVYAVSAYHAHQLIAFGVPWHKVKTCLNAADLSPGYRSRSQLCQYFSIPQNKKILFMIIPDGRKGTTARNVMQLIVDMLPAEWFLQPITNYHPITDIYQNADAILYITDIDAASSIVHEVESILVPLIINNHPGVTQIASGPKTRSFTFISDIPHILEELCS